MRWLASSVEMKHLEAVPIPRSIRTTAPRGTSSNEPSTPHETGIQFYAETAREKLLNGKRRLEIYLARPGAPPKALRGAGDRHPCGGRNRCWWSLDAGAPG